MMLDLWAKRWGIGADAIADLKLHMGILEYPDWHMLGRHDRTLVDKPGSEARQQDLISLEAARMQVRLFRNNSGALRADDGRMVRFGLGNVSKQWNEKFASPDLVGWRKVLITPDMVGCVIGQACMREVKHEGWTFNPRDAHEEAQLNFMKLAIADGCDAAFATGPGTL